MIRALGLCLVVLFVLILYVPAWSLPVGNLQMEWSSARHDLNRGRIEADIHGEGVKGEVVPLRIVRVLDITLPAPTLLSVPLTTEVLLC